MPKVVDRDERRREIVDAYLRIVSRSGVAAATSRALAAEAGISTGALWHYFDGFGDVVRDAFQRVYGQTNERIAAAADGARGLAALDAMAVDILPHDARTRDEATVVVSFWGLLPAHEGFREQSRAVEAEWGRQVSGHLREAIDDGELVADTPIAPLTDTLLAVFEALQLREVQGSPAAQPARQRAIIDHLLGPWRM
ncbi:TetR/AcrR family transcriptional regulator [Microbacterium sp. ASV49]|uniref:TetR family transcriptional regulator C-terminal domain-containing protein n=1 Tax=Microbacterium candidum TaxID=3041922 RepID=A0ABT7N0J9_9MICO|nr:TetR family transcriptional regulator C-terminal domain-containing protein [Microbacterium sp. ASV49]MDL9980227.1 TetR family transcriptional regulator C-terminal domain-containing protein [Microbacterium sp. ASV49]